MHPCNVAKSEESSPSLQNTVEKMQPGQQKGLDGLLKKDDSEMYLLFEHVLHASYIKPPREPIHVALMHLFFHQPTIQTMNHKVAVTSFSGWKLG